MADPETLNGSEFTVDIVLTDEERTKLINYVDWNTVQAQAAIELKTLRDDFVARAKELATTLPLVDEDIAKAGELFKPITDSEEGRLRHGGAVIYLADRSFDIGGEVKLTSEDTNIPKFRIGELAVAAVRPETGFVLAGLGIFSQEDDELYQDPSLELGFVINPSLSEQTVSGLMVPFENQSEVVAQMSDRLVN